jgi:hypothetical protein
MPVLAVFFKHEPFHWFILTVIIAVVDLLTCFKPKIITCLVIAALYIVNYILSFVNCFLVLVPHPRLSLSGWCVLVNRIIAP